jgi:hypothetical protein
LKFWQAISGESLILSVRVGVFRGVGKEMSKTMRGQILVVVVIILVIVVALIIFLPMLLAPHGSTPIVQDVFWKIDDRNVSSCFVGDGVAAHVVIEATDQYVGSVEIKIRKDVTFWFDSDYTTETFPVNLSGSHTTELVVTFAPDTAGGGSLRGYFVEVDFLATGSNWIMQSSYPPRLAVSTIAQGDHTPV